MVGFKPYKSKGVGYIGKVGSVTKAKTTIPYPINNTGVAIGDSSVNLELFQTAVV